ncbi:MAG: amidohydrolase family protein, partial [Coriobacteriales bacterium]|nr:amidohydrolase family protein [Coriobacteriales bacterium]
MYWTENHPVLDHQPASGGQMLLVARYVLPVSEPHIEDGAVLVRGGLIEAVGPAAELKAQYPDEELRDFGLAALMPGFVDAHTHLAYTAMRGLIHDVPYAEWKLSRLKKEKLLSAQDWEDSALLGALAARARATVTAVEPVPARAKLVRRAGAGLPVRVVVADGRSSGLAPGFDRVLVD